MPSNDDGVQPQPPESEQAQTPPTEPVAPTLDPTTSVPPVTNDESVEMEDSIEVPENVEPVIPEIPATAELPSPVAEIKQEPVIETVTETPAEPIIQESIQQDRADSESLIQPTEQIAPTEQVEPQERIMERVIEKEKPLTPEIKRAIFKEELAGHLSEANKAKHEHYEKHLQEIVDFIRAKATLVTNREIEAALDVPDSTIVNRLNELIQRGVVVRIGEGEHTKYRLTQAV